MKSKPSLTPGSLKQAVVLFDLTAPRLQKFWIYAALALLVLMQALPFTTGYRLTADDVKFHDIGMKGIAEVIRMTHELAISQGRLTHYIAVPITILADYYSGSYIFRIFVILFQFFSYVLFSIYISKLCKWSVSGLILLILISLQPLDYFHLPPNAYPFQVSYPVVMCLLSRLILLNNRVLWQQSLGIALAAAGSLYSEGGILFLIALIILERIVKYEGWPVPLWRSPWLTLRGFARNSFDKSMLRDSLTIACILLIYFAFRAMHPSGYHGNQISDAFQFPLFLKTIAGHIAGGTIFPAPFRNGAFVERFFPLISPYDVISGLAVFAVSYWIGLCLLRSASCKPVPAEKRWLPVLLLFSGIGAAIFVTAPVAAVAKYQDWCQSFKSCIFHDSRLSYYFTGLAIASGILMSVYRISEGVPSRALRTRSLALLISGFALLTYVHNRSLQYDMADYVSPWDRARRVACLPGPALDDLDPVSLITRGSRISVHPGFDVNSYWRSYLTGIRTSQRCATSTDQLTDMLPQAVPGIAYSFNRGGSGVAFLGNGWSQPEEWGTWSASNEANIVVLPKNHPTRMKLTLSAFIYPPIASQRAQVSINGDVVADLVLTSPVPGTIEISLPPNREERVLNLDFRLPDARSPKEIGMSADERRLSIGLISLDFLQ